MKDREAWCTAVHGVAKSWTQLSNWITRTFPPSWASLSSLHLTPLSHPRALSWAPCATCSSFPLAVLYLVVYKFSCCSFSWSHLFLLLLCPQVHSLHLRLYPALQIGSSVTFFWIPYMCINIRYFSLSDLWQPLDSSTSLQMTQFLSFLWLSNIPLYICTTISLSIHLSMDI